MKNLFNTTSIETKRINGFKNYHFSTVFSDATVKTKNNSYISSEVRTGLTRENLLTPDARLQMVNGQIPDLWEVCRDLFHTFLVNQSPYSALQFVPVMQEVNAIEPEQLQRFLNNPETRHVLIENELLKVVLIHWKPGKVSNIHGHPSGGCVFKILHGKIEELRYTTGEDKKILSSNGYRSGSIAYIDDRLGYHAVGNPFGSSAVSLHAYTPGK